MDLGLGITLAGGSISIAGIVLAFVQWSLKRNVQSEDAFKTTALEQHKDHEKRLAELETRWVKYESELHNAVALISEVKGILHEMRQGLDVTRDKQAGFYRDELGKAEERMRRDVIALETRMDTLEKRRRR